MSAELEKMWFDSIAWDLYTILGPVVIQSLVLITSTVVVIAVYRPTKIFPHVFTSEFFKCVLLTQVVSIALGAIWIISNYGWSLYPTAGQRIRYAGNLQSVIIIWGLTASALLLAGVLCYRMLVRESLLKFSVPASLVSSLGIALVCTLVLIFLVRVVPDVSDAMQKAESKDVSPGRLSSTYTLFLIGLTAISEEMFFRRVLLQYVAAISNISIGIIFSSLAFAAYHVDPQAFLWLFVAGAILGLSYAYSGRIWVSIGTHIFYSVLIWVGSQ